jgi:hypothetical protein
VRGFIAENLQSAEWNGIGGHGRHAAEKLRRSKPGQDRRGQPAEKPARQACVVAQNDPMGMGSIRHGLDIASRSE